MTFHFEPLLLQSKRRRTIVSLASLFHGPTKDNIGFLNGTKLKSNIKNRIHIWGTFQEHNWGTFG